MSAPIPASAITANYATDDRPSSPFKISHHIDYKDVPKLKHSIRKHCEESSRGQPMPQDHNILWYSQGFLRGIIIKSAHKDGTYDVAYLAEKDGSDIYVANSIPMHASFNEVCGFLDVGVPQQYMTTVRDRHKAALQVPQFAPVEAAEKRAIDNDEMHFTFTYNNSSLLREVRPWRASGDAQAVQAVQEFLKGGDDEERAWNSADDNDKYDDLGDPDEYLRAAYVSATVDLDQRADAHTPAGTRRTMSAMTYLG